MKCSTIISFRKAWNDEKSRLTVNMAISLLYCSRTILELGSNNIGVGLRTINHLYFDAKSKNSSRPKKTWGEHVQLQIHFMPSDHKCGLGELSIGFPFFSNVKLIR